MSRLETEPNSSDSALPAKRRGDIVRLVRQLGQVTVTDMSARFEVSLDTIRRDLDVLADHGLISRIHGGAVPAESMASADSPFEQRVTSHQSAKEIIGRAAARLIASGETLIVNGGSTAVTFAASLGALTRLTVVTNNLSLPAAVPAQALNALYLLGGEIRSGARITIGPVGFVGTRQIVADTAVIGVGGITEGGCSTSHIEEATMMAAMIAAARRTIVIADSTKFGRLGFAVVAPLDQLDVLVTDAPPPDGLKDALEAAGVRIVIAS
ncbi:MAG: DeoR/GlpR transcriptional regulator [Hyphomicrobiales bacterium]|nr:DeoR/GlpR family DNA-binding transcription regulator [Hyphomicrobiales bacterium]MDE2016523.1 DeoR/GlpR transcriptional regulator [Hyphomicrobiales bacterium]